MKDLTIINDSSDEYMVIADGAYEVFLNLAGSNLIVKSDYTTGCWSAIEGAEEIVPDGASLAGSVTAYCLKHAEQLGLNYLGVWRDPDHPGTVTLDLSRHFDTQEEALAFAAENHQKAIYNTDKQEVIYLGE